MLALAKRSETEEVGGHLKPEASTRGPRRCGTTLGSGHPTVSNGSLRLPLPFLLLLATLRVRASFARAPTSSSSSSTATPHAYKPQLIRAHITVLQFDRGDGPKAGKGLG